MDIERLLEKYYEGETTTEEERELKSFFKGSQIPEHLRPYASLFTYWEKEAEKAVTEDKVETNEEATESFSLPIHSGWYAFLKKYGSIAAIFLLVIGLTAIRFRDLSQENYVIIDGKKYTDISLVREQAKAAFMDVSFNDEDILNTLFGD